MASVAGTTEDHFWRKRTKLERMRPRDYVPPRGKYFSTLKLAYGDPRPRKLTRQGVPDLNGPRANGLGYNGAASASCPHFRDPQSVSTHTLEKLTVDDLGFPKRVRHVHCSTCGYELGDPE